MYKILCLTSGEFIKLGPFNYQFSALPTQYEFDWMGIDKGLNDEIYVDKTDGTLWFASEKSADWFMRRRLTYNKIRVDGRKLAFMKSIFDASRIDHWETMKLEFVIQKSTSINALTKVVRGFHYA